MYGVRNSEFWPECSSDKNPPTCVLGWRPVHRLSYASTLYEELLLLKQLRLGGFWQCYCTELTVPPPQWISVRVKMQPHVPAMPLGLVFPHRSAGHCPLVAATLSCFIEMKPFKPDLSMSEWSFVITAVIVVFQIPPNLTPNLNNCLISWYKIHVWNLELLETSLYEWNEKEINYWDQMICFSSTSVLIVLTLLPRHVSLSPCFPLCPFIQLTIAPQFCVILSRTQWLWMLLEAEGSISVGTVRRHP